MPTHKIIAKQWEVRETAQYKLLHKGMHAVSDRELLTLIVGNEQSSQALLDVFGSLAAMARISLQEFQQIPGIGPRKAMLLVSTFELSRRKSEEDQPQAKMNSSEAVAKRMIPKLADASQEQFIVLFLNRNNTILAEETLFTGGISATVIDTRIIFKRAVCHLASAIILIHNHPSGCLTPSKPDMEVTKKVKEVGNLLDIQVLDHVIVSSKGYYSFADHGEI